MKQQKKPKKKSVIKRIVLALFIFALTFTLAATGAVLLIYNSQTLSADKLANFPRALQVYADNGDLIEDAGDFHHTSLENVPEHTKWAFICTEDKNFYNHHGIAPARIIKATFNNISSGKAKEGASTISQQLIKNTHLTHEKTMQRKIREAALAVKLENKYSKNEILEMYLNAIYFGNGVYGLESASHFYFDKPAPDLTLRESAALAGLIRNPARFDPLTNFDNFVLRSDLVLKLMHDQKRITDDEYNAAAKETPVVNTAKKPKTHASDYKAAAAAEAAELLNISASDLGAFGYRIHTYFDPDTQNAIVTTAKSPDHAIKNTSGNPADQFIISAKNSGEITAVYATSPTLRSAKRNFASSLKPIAVYAPALELGVVSPATKILDEPFTAGDFHPHNHDGKHRGEVTVRQALEQSLNVPTVKVLDYTRLNRAIEIGRNMGLNLTNEEDVSLALGNAKNGTTFNELLGSYCTLARGGIKATPHYVKLIKDREGKTVYTNSSETHARAIGEDTAFLLTNMLQSGAKHGTARSLSSLDFDIAAKTGTSERTGVGTNTDAVNCSYTTDNVLIVWTGNASMKPENDLPQGTTGGGITSFIARDIQSAISKTPKPFNAPASITQDSATGEYYAKRYEEVFRAQTQAFTKPVAVTIDGKISGSGHPEITFGAVAHQHYEIYKDGLLQEIVKDHSGEYTFTDTCAQKGKTYEYHVVTENMKSNAVKLYTANDINQNAAPKKKDSGKHWFF
jgi:penicillin-binding protein 2A